MTEILHQFPANDPKVREAERILAANPGALSRETAAAKLAALGINPPDCSPLSAAAVDPALDNVRAILARDDLTPEYRAMLEKTIAGSAALRAKHDRMKAAALKKAATP